MNKPYVSVIMPMYNQEKYIEKCLNSVLAQTLNDIEIIVVNDGSTDNSMKIVSKIAEKDSRVKIVDKPNSGYGNSVNIGIDRAIGHYIGIVETDDFISPQMFEVLYSLSNNGEIDVIKGNFYDYYEDSDGKGECFENQERSMVPELQTSFSIRECPQLLWGHPSVWSAIYKKSFIDKNGIRFKEVKGGGWVDNPFFFETLCKAESIKWTKEPLYYYRKTSVGSSSTGVVNPNLPFDRMNDNFDVLNSNHFTDETTRKLAYSRALMYTTGALKECDYVNNYDLINRKAKELLQRCDVDVFWKYFNDKDCLLYHEFTSPIKTIAATFPKILIYNWLPFDNQWNWGGGVTVYCKNIIKTILKEYPFAQIYFLSSGFAYNAERTDTFIREIPNIFGDRCRQFEVVNSPVPAAQDKLFVNPTVAIENEVLKETINNFLESFGPFECVHFNNIEGLSLDVLDLKKEHKGTRFVYSMHNYVPICVTGFYYQRHKHCNCNPNHTAEDCFLCTRKAIKRNIADEVYKSAMFAVDEERSCSKEYWVKNLGIDRLDIDVNKDNILQFAKTAVEKINDNCDTILAVSKRVKDIAVENGIDSNKTIVSYIGTEIASSQVGKSLYKPKNGLKVVFLGNSLHYEEKGFPFLLNALSKLDERYASKIDITLTVRDKQHGEIYQMLKKFKSVKVIQGYTHDDLKDIFKGANLSIVPVLWEDNLPQIAIESVAFGVPVLASSCGGASELTSNSLFCFEGGNEQSLRSKLIHFVEHPEDIELYWSGHNGLITMQQHLKEMLPIYGLPLEPSPISISMKDYAFLLFENEFLHKHVILDGNSADIESLKQKLTEYENHKDERERNERIVKALDRLCPKGTLRRKIAKKVYRMLSKRR